MNAAADQEAYDLNHRLALVCVDDADRRAAVTGAVEELGYRVQVGENRDEVLDRLRKQTFEVIVLDDAFQGASATDHPVLHQVQWMPMTVRRYVFVALLGAALKTFDNMTAFSKSVNLVVNYTDVAQIKPILQRAVAENDEFYRVFRRVLQEAGKR